MKIEYGHIMLSKVGLNWLMDDKCKIYILEDQGGTETWLI